MVWRCWYFKYQRPLWRAPCSAVRFAKRLPQGARHYVLVADSEWVTANVAPTAALFAKRECRVGATVVSRYILRNETMQQLTAVPAKETKPRGNFDGWSELPNN